MVKKLTRHIICCEGPDGAGKTKLCQHLIEKYRFNYYHCGVQPDIKTYHGDVLDLAFKDINTYNNNFLIDRLHLSEEVYGNLFRSGPQYNWKELNQKIIDNSKDCNIKYTLILCLPPKTLVLNTHSMRNEDGNEMFDTVDPVYDAYLKIYEENSNSNEFDIYKYDFTEDGDYTKLDEYLEKDV